MRSRFEAIQRDSGVQAVFQFLVTLSSGRIQEFIPETGPATPFALANALHGWLDSKRESLEYAQIAEGATNDAITAFYRDHNQQTELFSEGSNDSAVWRQAASGAGFCELARLFFAKFTARYLNYFLEREASVACSTIAQRDRFEERLTEQIDGVSRHAFETAKITQSFAAGWYNRHAAHRPPSDAEVEGFLSVAFGKIREELRRESRD